MLRQQILGSLEKALVKTFFQTVVRITLRIAYVEK